MEEVGSYQVQWPEQMEIFEKLRSPIPTLEGLQVLDNPPSFIIYFVSF